MTFGKRREDIMTHYRLSTNWNEGLVPHTVDGDAYRTYFANQAAGILQPNTIPIKEEKKEPEVVVKLVSEVQNAVDQAEALTKHEEEKKTDYMESPSPKRKRKTVNEKTKRRVAGLSAYGSKLGPPGRKLNF